MSDLTKILSSHQQVLLQGFAGGSFAKILARIHLETQNPLLIVVSDDKRALELKDEIDFFLGSDKSTIFPSFDVAPYSGLSPHVDLITESQKILHNLLMDLTSILITTPQALCRRLLKKDFFLKSTLTLIKNDVLDRDEFLRNLVLMGYTRAPLVEETGQFAIRGDIVDVFSPQMIKPVRISLFDIEVEDIKSFDSQSQRTQESLTQINIIPAHFILFNQLDTDEPCIRRDWRSELKRRADALHIPKSKRDRLEEIVENKIYFQGVEFYFPLFYQETSPLFDYLSRRSFIVNETGATWQALAQSIQNEIMPDLTQTQNIDHIITPQDLFITPEEIDSQMAAYTQLTTTLIGTETPAVFEGQNEANTSITTKLSAEIAREHNLAGLTRELNEKRNAGFDCVIVCSAQSQKERIKDLLSRFDLPLSEPEDSIKSGIIDQMVMGKTEGNRLIKIITGNLHQGFLSYLDRQWWITDEEVFGKKTRRATSRSSQTAVFSSFSELSVSDYLIHKDHGIGIYQGLVKLDLDIHKNDFLLIEYLGGDKLYVPIDKLDRVQRFVAAEGTIPQLDKLGGMTWIKTRSKAKKAARKLAGELLDLQAKRQALVGYAFNANDEMMEEFSASFDFEETPDQLRAIEDVIGDMQNQRPMDRLICGDVGYGKTEVAMRAAFKAVSDHKQVAILVPTTVLAFQHYTTFSERFKNYGIKIDLLSRFRSDKEQKETLEKIKQGEIDIIVGTHRLLSNDIKFRDLGLLIVDEEHRFGVVQKERIKKLKNLVDIMTLTATPIPRTLNFALNGIRDLSIINTPPVDRLAVKTYTCYFDDVNLRESLLKEIHRGGQVYFVHNRVQSIEKTASYLAKLMPEARVKMGHGQMTEDTLEKVMIEFMNHEFDIFVCTTIIESGLDIPNANTIIINRADTFGLAQLYQLRGRVGRSHRQAYCYLIIPAEELLTEKARKRLAVIQRFTELGSGFKIATHDLEIRGAGNILGDEQSGHIAAVGYDMYIQLLQEAIAELKNISLPEDFEPELGLSIPAKIPETFIPDTQVRLTLYKHISSATNFEEIATTLEEWMDRFGKLPDEIHNLANLIKIKILCKMLLISALKQSGTTITMAFHPHHKLNPQVFIDAIQRNPKKFSLTRDGQFAITEKFSSAQTLLDYLIELLLKLKEAE